MHKIILHLDFNSFFASVEQQANPFLRGKPIAVAGKGRYSIDVAGHETIAGGAAVGTPTAHRRVRRTEHRRGIRRDRTRRASIDIRKASLRRTVVTTASKEAKALGVKTAMASTEAERICPELITIPGDPVKYSNITRRFMEILNRYADAVERFSTDEAFADITNAASDYVGAALIAQMIRQDIARECGAACTASIGIGPNKLIAKLACESMKPNGLTIVPPDSCALFVRTVELQDICGIGPRIERRLNLMGISSTTNLQKVPLHRLVREFKNYGHFLYNAAQGLGDDCVSPENEKPKSYGNSYTFPHDLKGARELKPNLLALCDRVAWRMRRGKCFGTPISVYARYANPSPRDGGAGGGQRIGFHGPHTSKRINEPLVTGLDIFRNAWGLIEPRLDLHQGIRLLGISVSGLFEAQPQVSFFKKQQKMHRVLGALDDASERYGRNIWQRAATLGTHFKARVSGWHYDHEG